MKKILSVFFLCCVWVLSVAQTGTVSGVVTSSEDDSPLAGVAVILEGTSHGTMTSDDGSWSLTIGESDGGGCYCSPVLGMLMSARP